MTALALFAATFFLVLFLGLQSLNVNGGHKLMAAVTSFGISTANIVVLKTMPGPTGLHRNQDRIRHYLVPHPDRGTFQHPARRQRHQHRPNGEIMNLVSLIEKIHWSVAADVLPDADETVHICMPGSDEPVWLGYFDGTTWRTSDGFPVKAGEVTYWAPMLKGPEAS